MRQIGIDLDVHRVIENGRLSFDEDYNAILRRLLAIDARSPRAVRSSVVARQPRSSGAYALMLGTQPIEANSLKELLRRVLLKAEQLRPGTIEKMAEMPTPRGRFVVARSAQRLYPNAPHLAELAEPLGSQNWWYDTNVSRKQVQASMKVIARLLELPAIPTISKRSEKTPMTAADLGLAVA